MELGRNDGEDLKNAHKIVRDLNQGQFEWAFTNKKNVPAKLKDILENSEPREPRNLKESRGGPRQKNKNPPKEFLREREEEDEDDDEFQPMDEELQDDQDFEDT